LRVLKAARLASGGDTRFYRAARNRTAEVFDPCVAARAPELRRPRFSFLYNQLVKEPNAGNPTSLGEEQAPHSAYQLRPFDRIDQLETVKTLEVCFVSTGVAVRRFICGGKLRLSIGYFWQFCLVTLARTASGYPRRCEIRERLCQPKRKKVPAGEFPSAPGSRFR
jgi:hypothetical protein